MRRSPRLRACLTTHQLLLSGFGVIFAEGLLSSKAQSVYYAPSGASSEDLPAAEDFLRADAEDEEIFARAAEMLKGDGLPVKSKLTETEARNAA